MEKEPKKRKYKGKDHTFVICAYKESAYLEECILSLKRQSVKSHLIMVTSTENDFIKEMAKKYSIELFIRKEKSNIAGDWNFGYEQAKTPLITIAHQDDIYKTDYLKEGLYRVNHARHPLIYFTNYYDIRNNREVSANSLLKIKRCMLIPLIPRMLQKSRWIRRRVLSLGCPILCPSVMFVKEHLPNPVFQVGMRASLDWEAWEKISKLKGEFLYTTKALTCHRIHEESETSAAIGDSVRTKEDYVMFCKFWPKPIARMLQRIYATSENSNKVSS